MKKIIYLCFAVFISTAATAQKKSSVSNFPGADGNRWMVGGNAGTTLLLGDANKIKLGYVIGAEANYAWSHTFGLRAAANYGRLNGGVVDGEKAYSNFSFKNNIWDVVGQMTFTLGNISYMETARQTNLFFGLGVGLIGNNATSEYVVKKDPGQTKQTGEFKEFYSVYAFTAGLRRDVSNSLAIGMLLDVRAANGDLVDNLQMPNFGNRANDMYFLIQPSVIFKLGDKSKQHVQWVNPVETMYEDLGKLGKKMDELSKDEDNDGVANMFDKDPNTPEGAKVYGDGTAVDTDRDGIVDQLDMEPNSPFGAKVDSRGKAIDNDGDGVPDIYDLSPNTSSDMLVNHQGIPIMTKDLAKQVAEGKSSGKSSGQSSGQSSASGTTMSTGFPAIFFETGSSNLTAKSVNDLLSIAEFVKANPSLKLEIIGHTDYTGGEKVNQKLGLLRAEAIKKVLMNSFGIKANQLSTRTSGSKEPVAVGKDALSLAANRRVQFFVTK